MSEVQLNKDGDPLTKAPKEHRMLAEKLRGTSEEPVHADAFVQPRSNCPDSQELRRLQEERSPHTWTSP